MVLHVRKKWPPVSRPEESASENYNLRIWSWIILALIVPVEYTKPPTEEKKADHNSWSNEEGFLGWSQWRLATDRVSAIRRFSHRNRYFNIHWHVHFLFTRLYWCSAEIHLYLNTITWFQFRRSTRLGNFGSFSSLLPSIIYQSQTDRYNNQLRREFHAIWVTRNLGNL